MIREATLLTSVLWGEYRDGMITFIRPEMTTAQRADAHPPGWSYRMAGWVESHPSSDGKPCLRAPYNVARPADLYRWKWSGSRGGALRRTLESHGVYLGAPGESPDVVIRNIRARGICEACDNPAPRGECDLCGADVR